MKVIYDNNGIEIANDLLDSIIAKTNDTCKYVYVYDSYLEDDILIKRPNIDCDTLYETEMVLIDDSIYLELEKLINNNAPNNNEI
jgi:hypothetical protein